MGRPRDRVSTALRLDRALHERLRDAATERGVGVNWLICRLCSEGLDNLVPVGEIRWVRGPEERVSE